MNILIIDDQVNNIKNISSALNKVDDSVMCYPLRGDAKKFSENIISKISSNNLQMLINDIKQIIIKNDIDLIVLDLALTNEEKDYATTRTSGITLLNTLLNGGEKHLKYIPFFVYSIMSVQELSAEAKANIVYASQKPSMTVDKIKRDFLHNDKELFKILISHANKYKFLKKKNSFDSLRNSDIVVICALKKEIKPVLSLLEDKIEENETFGIGYIKDKNDKKLKVVAITKEQMGMAEAATLTTQMIGKYNPTYVVMTGIAGGIDIEGQNFLDVLMPSYIHNWQSGKFKQKNEADKILHVFEREYSSVKTYIEEKPDLSINEDGLHIIPENFLKEENFEGNVDAESIQQYLLEIKKKESKKRSEFKREILKLYEKDEQEIKDEIEKIKKGNKTNKEKMLESLNNKLSQLPNNNLAIDFIKKMKRDLPCDIQKDGMVSGSAVVADEYVVSESIANRKINGIDMEAYGVVYACNQHPRKPKVLILKAICDFADDNKNDIYQSAAAYVSAQVFYKLFTEYIDMESNT